MRTKCPKQFGHFPREEDHRYAPHPKVKPHLKNAWQSPEPIGTPKMHKPSMTKM